MNSDDPDKDSLDELNKLGLNAARSTNAEEARRSSAKSTHSRGRYTETQDEAWLRREHSAGATFSDAMESLEDSEAIANAFSKSQSKKGLKRWSKDESKEIVREIISRLSKRTDALGDPLPAKELWGDFWSELEQAGLRPQGHERDDGGYDYDGGPMSFKTFQNRLSDLNKSR